MEQPLRKSNKLMPDEIEHYVCLVQEGDSGAHLGRENPYRTRYTFAQQR
ncbi:hypothetical protein J2T17_007353 [Paenibacillus mucilaginosus]